MADSLFVIDSTFLLETSHNAFYGAPLLHDSSGRDTTMLFGVARDLLRFRKQLGMRQALIVIGDTGSCVPGQLVSDTIDLLKRLQAPVLYAKGERAGDLGQVGRKLAMRGDALRERCRELHFRSASLGDLKGRYGETNFIEDVESAASALKEYGFWSLIRLLPLPEQELVRAEENPTRPDYRAARTPAELDELHKLVKAAEVCALDTEASDRDPRNAVLYGIAFSVIERQAVYVPLIQSDLGLV